jgi:hypothetical protein
MNQRDNIFAAPTAARQRKYSIPFLLVCAVWIQAFIIFLKAAELATQKVIVLIAIMNTDNVIF